MGKDYYAILGVSKGADDATLKKGRHRMQDKNKDNREQAEAKFKEVSEAFEVLSDPQKKRIYDAYGEDGLKGGGPSDSSSASGFHPGGWRPRAADDIFAEFFGDNGATSFFSSSNGAQTFFSTVGSGPDFAGGGFPGMGGRGGMGSASSQPQTVQRALPCTLEDLYTGRMRKMKIKRKIFEANSGREMEVEDIVEIDVKPGWKDGTKVTFAGKGDELRGRPAQDVQFVIKEQPHSLFKREGNDLVYTARIQLVDALAGGRFTLQHLNGNNVPIAFAGPVNPTTVQAMRGLGMPISKEQGKFGDLKVKFNVAFPTQLSDDQKKQLKAILQP